ncbi:MAG: hypothetical protein QW350_00115 [Candidatus Aenigmatarchaeota archaeon]|nr:hypothetical protein [Candidatus Aenigmarchaeota archaeon]
MNNGINEINIGGSYTLELFFSFEDKMLDEIFLVAYLSKKNNNYNYIIIIYKAPYEGPSEDTIDTLSKLIYANTGINPEQYRGRLVKTLQGMDQRYSSLK